MNRHQNEFPNHKSGLNYALSNQPILLNGMKVIFDQSSSVYPVSLESKQQNNGLMEKDAFGLGGLSIAKMENAWQSKKGKASKILFPEKYEYYEEKKDDDQGWNRVATKDKKKKKEEILEENIEQDKILAKDIYDNAVAAYKQWKELPSIDVQGETGNKSWDHVVTLSVAEEVKKIAVTKIGTEEDLFEVKEIENYHNKKLSITKKLNLWGKETYESADKTIRFNYHVYIK